MNQNIEQSVCQYQRLSIEQQWNTMENAVQTIAMENLAQPTNKKQDWMIDDNMDLINKQRIVKNKKELEYKKMQRFITRKIKH